MNAQASPWAPVGALLAAAGWAGLASAEGGIDVGERLGPGPTALALALILASAAAATALWQTREDALWRSGPARLALGGLTGLTALAAASMAWAPQPHIAWIEANQNALYLMVGVLAAALTARLRPTAERLSLLLAGAAAVPVLAALAIEVLPGLLGNDLDPGRLTRPAGYHNGLALIAVAGIVATACSGPRRGRDRALAGAATTLFATALVLTLSRGGILALAVALATLLVLRRPAGIAIRPLVAGAAGAVIPVAWGLSQQTLTDERVAVSLRQDDGLLLGALLAAGVAVGAVGAAARLRRPGGAGIAVIALMVVVATAVGGPDAVAGNAPPPETPGASAVDNSPGRALSLRSNNRDAWWGEAWRGFESAPVLGNGAGSFRMVHLRERRDDSTLFITRQPHQILLKMLSDLGLAGLLLLVMWPAGVLWALTRADRAGPAAPAAAVLAGFLAQAQFDWLFSLPATGALAAACGGVILAAGASGPRRPLAGEPARIAALAAVAGVVVVSAALPWLALREVDAADRAIAAGDTAAALGHAERAAALNPLSPRPLEEMSFAHFLDGDLAAAVADRRRLTELQPENPFAWAGLATLLRGEAAEAAWERVIALDPNNPAARRALGRQ